MDHEAWLRPLHPAPGAGVRLLCLPHAGAAADSFRGVAAALAPELDVWAVQYPGRQDRSREDQLPTAQALAAAVAQAWTAVDDDRPFALLGHSMGALVAYETARLLERRPARGDRPLRVLLSGQTAPEIHERRTDLPGDDGLLAELARLGGSEAVLADDDLTEAMLPALRADYRILRDYRWAGGPALRAPLSVLCGDADPLTPIDDAARWLRHSVVPGRFHVVAGGHFFLPERPDEVAEAVRADLRRSARGLAR